MKAQGFYVLNAPTQYPYTDNKFWFNATVGNLGERVKPDILKCTMIFTCATVITNTGPPF